MGEFALVQVIRAIGSEEFAHVLGNALRVHMGFDLSALVLHHPESGSSLLHDNFDTVGARIGIENYVRFTHQVNPMLLRMPATGVCRARDFAACPQNVGKGLEDYVVRAPEEELGFRTVGWPERLEEVGLYFEACGGRVELSFYRPRESGVTPVGKLRQLDALRGPVAAAFERHTALLRAGGPFPASLLSKREQQVYYLLMEGCSSEAIGLRLGISRHTVKDHRKRIFRKLGIGSLAELFALSVSRGITPLPGGMAIRPWREASYVLQ